MRAAGALCAATLFLAVASGSADGQLVGEYRVSFTGRAQHEVEVVAQIPTGGRDEVLLWMPSWTPGSYKIRDHSRFVVALEARSPGGAPLRVNKREKSTWAVGAPGLDRFELRYRLLCADLTVRTNHVEERFASLVPAATWILPLEPIEGEVDVRFELPAEWPHLETALPPYPSGEPRRFLADIDTLYDSPILCGDLDLRDFEVRGVPHRLVSHGGSGFWDFAKAADDCRRIAEALAEFWGGIPYRDYRILNLVVEAGGGLEHASSTHLMTSRDAFRDPERYRDWLMLVCHELFHAWNGKRLGPVALGPKCFLHGEEIHTPDLWVVEGLTSYYEELLLARAGLLSRKQYLAALSKSIERVQETPGRKVHSLAAASRDAWTHHYQPHAHSKSTTVSYYTKGAVAGFLLDAEIRAASGGARSLDDAMRRAYLRFAGSGYTSEEFRALCSETAGRDLSAFFALAVDSTEELDHAPALEWFGLHFAPSKKKKGAAEGEDSDASPAEGDEEGAPEPGWLGFATAIREGRLVVTEVPAGTLAHDAGFAVDDEVIAVAGVRALPGGWEARMKQHPPGERVEILIARRGELRTIAVTLGAEPERSWKLEVREDATPEQKARLAAWLGAAGADLVPPPAPGVAPESPAAPPTPGAAGG